LNGLCFCSTISGDAKSLAAPSAACAAVLHALNLLGAVVNSDNVTVEKKVG
jgi:hypothetical protein